MHTRLLSPHFLAVISLASSSDQSPLLVHLKLYRLEHDSARHAATICLLGARQGSFAGMIACDTDIAPGEEGLMVIEVFGAIVSRAI